jgi:hypothetical protein
MNPLLQSLRAVVTFAIVVCLLMLIHAAEKILLGEVTYRRVLILVQFQAGFCVSGSWVSQW